MLIANISMYLPKHEDRSRTIKKIDDEYCGYYSRCIIVLIGDM